MYKLHFLRLTVFSNALLDASVFCTLLQGFDFKNSIVTISYDFKSVFNLRTFSM